MSARLAHYDDLEAFIGLARLCQSERNPELPFDPQLAGYTFGGLARADPAIHVLENGSDVVGFALTRMGTLPFCSARFLRLELLFVQREHRSPEAERCLLDLLHGAAAFMQPAELTIGMHPDAVETCEHLKGLGYQIDSTQMKFCGTFDVGSCAPPMKMH